MAFMMSLGYFTEAFIGLIGAVFGSIVSTRMMLFYSKRHVREKDSKTEEIEKFDFNRYRMIREGNLFNRFLESLLEGGKNGLDIGFQIIPGVLIICTLVLMMTFGAPPEGYDGGAFQGIPILSWIGRYLSFPLKWLFGFTSPDAIAFPITALGAVGAALALVPKFLELKLIGGNEIAVFTSIGMCWSGYLSTHIAMMDVMGFRKLTTKAIVFHSIGGLCAGIFSHYLYVLVTMLF